MADKNKTRSNSIPCGKSNTMPHKRSTAHRKASEQLHLSPSATIDETRSNSAPVVKSNTMPHKRSTVHRKVSEQLHLLQGATMDEIKCEPDKKNEQQETDDEDVFTSSEQSEEKQTSKSDNPDNLNQTMTRSNSAPVMKFNTMPHKRSTADRKTRSNSAPAVKFNTMPHNRSTAHRKASEQLHLSPSATIDEIKCEPDKRNVQQETDDEDVFTSSEQSDEKQTPETENPDNLNQAMTSEQLHLSPSATIDEASEQLHLSPSATIDKTHSRYVPTDKYNTWAPTRSFGLHKKKPARSTIVNKPEADKGNGQKETGAEGDQPDSAPPTLPSKSVSELSDRESLTLVYEMTFRDLSQNIGREWERVASYLGVKEKKLEHIKIDNPHNVAQQIFCMLMTWKSTCENFGSSSFNALADILEGVGRKQLADKLRGKF